MSWREWLALFVCVMLFRVQGRALMRAIINEGKKTMTALEDLQAEVKETRSVELSAIKLINGLADRLEEALHGADSDDAIEAIVTDLRAGSADLSAAVAANTAADPSGSTGPKSFDGSSATANTSSPATEDLPDGHPLKPVTEPVAGA